MLRARLTSAIIVLGNHRMRNEANGGNKIMPIAIISMANGEERARRCSEHSEMHGMSFQASARLSGGISKL